MTRSNSTNKLVALLAALTMVAAACGGGDSEGSEGSTSGSTSGVNVSGSSTVEPIAIRVAEDFKTVDGDVKTQVSGPGTGDGFKLFCEGGTDISNASRTIKDSEAENCKENGINYVELKVAVDGIAVMTNPANTAVECLSFADLYALVGPESAGFETWAAGNEIAADAGGDAGLPDAPLVISAPGTESGTYDSFVEIVLEGIAEERGEEPDARIDYSSAADDNVIIETLATNDTSFGWVGFAFAVENADRVKLIDVKDADGNCVTPTPETIASNEYPIARDLFIYVNTGSAANNEGLVAFVDHFMDFGLDTAVAEAGYVPLTDEAKAATRAAWTGR